MMETVELSRFPKQKNTSGKMGGCISCSGIAKQNKKKHVQMEEYNTFCLLGKMPNPTNSCDVRYLYRLGDYATFASGNFLRSQALFSLIPGVLRTRCGYSGGKENIGDESENSEDHAQVVDIEFDPIETTYKELLECFWLVHDAFKKPEEVKYSSKIFYHTQDQKKIAEESLIAKDRMTPDANARVFTTIEPAMHVFLAKTEDQQYFLQQDKYLTKIVNCTTAEQFAFSHLAAKLNAFCSGFATVEMFETQMGKDDLNLDEMAIAYIKEKIKMFTKQDKRRNCVK